MTGLTWIGNIPRGTRIQVTKVVQFKYGFAMAPSPLFFTFGRIKDGEYAGQLVEVNEAGIQALPLSVDATLVTACNHDEKTRGDIKLFHE